MMWLWSLRSHSKFILVSCCVAIFSDVLFYGVLPPTLPYDLRDRIGLLPDSGKRKMPLGYYGRN